MPSHTWKDKERQVAQFFGLPSNRGRTPLSGGNSGHTRSDTLHPVLFIEQKHRKKNPWIDLWKKVNQLAKKENKVPVVTMTLHGHRGFWIMCHSSDLIAVANQRKKVKETIE